MYRDGSREGRDVYESRGVGVQVGKFKKLGQFLVIKTATRTSSKALAHDHALHARKITLLGRSFEVAVDDTAKSSLTMLSPQSTSLGVGGGGLT
jgi:adenylate cyclase class IV